MIPYQLVSMAAIMRDFSDDISFVNDEHEKLVDIADYLYNVGGPVDQLQDAYKKLYDKYGKDFFDKVLDDMSAIDSQITSTAKEDELSADYADRIVSYRADGNITAAKTIKADTEDDALIQVALDLINEYSREEFGRDEDRYTKDNDLTDLGLMYTTHGNNEEIDLQVSADLIHPAINFYVRGYDSGDYELRHQDKYNSLEELIDNELMNIDWDSLYSACLDYVTSKDFDPEYSAEYIDDYEE